jgi:hypothetical protein
MLHPHSESFICQWILESPTLTINYYNASLTILLISADVNSAGKNLSSFVSTQTQMMIHRPRLLSRMMRRTPQLNSFIYYSTIYAVRTNVSEATGLAPGAIAFHHDMIANQPLAFYFDAINNQGQLRVDKDIQRINSKRYDYDYKVCQQVIRCIFDFTKLDPRWEVPFVINQVHVNGNVTIQLTPHVRERVNIRYIQPYKPATNSVLIQSVGS